MGASGRVGLKLVEAVLADPGLELAAAFVSPRSQLLGRPVANGSIEYRTPDADFKSNCDVVVDFSNPAASLHLQDLVGTKDQPMVIGTTGFSAAQDSRLSAHARHRPLLISPNFAFGFEAFKLAVLQFARQTPSATPTIIETYHSNKKVEPSGTSLQLAALIRQIRQDASTVPVDPSRIVVQREAGVVGDTEVRFDLSVADVRFKCSVQTLAAYAEGALAAARWLVQSGASHGRFGLADSLNPTGVPQ
jgi:4-hydroxy-tetrahydrodipicolinate reductase